jgi:hypothetical protein
LTPASVASATSARRTSSSRWRKNVYGFSPRSTSCFNSTACADGLRCRVGERHLESGAKAAARDWVLKCLQGAKAAARDWVLKCLQGGRAHPLATCGVATLLLSRQLLETDGNRHQGYAQASPPWHQHPWVPAVLFGSSGKRRPRSASSAHAEPRARGTAWRRMPHEAACCWLGDTPACGLGCWRV